MRFKRLKLSAVLLFVLGLTGLQAQNMYVKESSGTQTAYALSSIETMTFSSGNLTVNKTDNSSSTYALSDLRYLSFSDIATSFDESLSVQSKILSAYPNPVSNILYIDLSETAKVKGTLSILNFEGKTVLSRQINQAEVLSLDISHLPEGIYHCLYSSVSEVQTVKIIKQ